MNCTTSDRGFGFMDLLLRDSRVARLRRQTRLPLQGDPRESEAEAQRRLDRARNAPRDLGCAAEPPTISDGYLKDPQARTGGAHLHFEIPAIGHFAHAEPVERSAPDRAKGAHVGISNAVKKPGQRTRRVSRRDLQRIHAAGLTFAPGSRADHKIMGARKNWSEQFRHEFGPVAAVAIEKDDDVRVARRLGAGGAGAAVAPLPLSATMMSSTRSRGTARITSPIGSSSFSVGMTRATRGRRGSAAAGAGARAAIRGSSGDRSARKPRAERRSAARGGIPDNALRSRFRAGSVGSRRRA